MTKKILLFAIILCTNFSFGQTKNHKYGFTAGGFIQHYKGELGNSLFQFNTTCFAGVNANFGVYMNRSFDFNVGGAIGNYGYCQTDADKNRIVSNELRCPGCKDRLGMGELRSLMVSGNVAMKYKFANGYFFKENAKFAPYIYLGMGINNLTDNMGVNCVNAGNFITLNSGLGLTYNLTERLNFSYNLALGSFLSKNVFATNGQKANDDHHDEGHNEEGKDHHGKDLYMQNALTVGFNF